MLLNHEGYPYMNTIDALKVKCGFTDRQVIEAAIAKFGPSQTLDYIHAGCIQTINHPEVGPVRNRSGEPHRTIIRFLMQAAQPAKNETPSQTIARYLNTLDTGHPHQKFTQLSGWHSSIEAIPALARQALDTQGWLKNS